MSRNFITPNHLFMKVEDTYRAALIDLNVINIATKEPAPKEYYLYLFPEMYVPFTEEKLPNVIKYKMGAIGANKELPRPMWGIAEDSCAHGWKIEGGSGYCIFLTEKHVRDLRRKFLDKAIEPLVTKETLKGYAHANLASQYGTLAQNQMASQHQMASQQQYQNATSTSNSIYYNQMSGATQVAPYYGTSVATTTAGSGGGFWSSIGSALGF